MQNVSEGRNFLKFRFWCEIMDFDYDVIIIGAGPVGGYTARVLSERGLSVLMVEEHNEVGRPFQCAGLVTPSAMDAVEAYDTVVADVDGALIHGPSGTLVPVGKEGELRTYVVCRKRFDQTVVQQGLEAGSDIMLESQPVSADVQQDGGVVEIVNQRTDQTTTLRSKLLIVKLVVAPARYYGKSSGSQRMPALLLYAFTLLISSAAKRRSRHRALL